jgi:hypothetical protein
MCRNCVVCDGRETGEADRAGVPVPPHLARPLAERVETDGIEASTLQHQRIEAAGSSVEQPAQTATRLNEERILVVRRTSEISDAAEVDLPVQRSRVGARDLPSAIQIGTDQCVVRVAFPVQDTSGSGQGIAQRGVDDQRVAAAAQIHQDLGGRGNR